jgi:type II secretory pathway pseudopilin PulG
MKFRANPQRSYAGKRRLAGFTLAEVLAALAFMAIVIPVAIEGLRIANLAGQVGQGKGAALRVAERVLNEQIIGSQLGSRAANGTAQEGLREYRWQVRTESWPEDTMNLVTVQVTYKVQEQDYDVFLSTLMGSTR